MSSVTFRSGKTSDDLSIVKQSDVESRFAGWISCFVDDPTHKFIKIEVKGPDNSLRFVEFHCAFNVHITFTIPWGSE